MVKNLLLLLLAATLTFNIQAQSFEGKDFWVGYMENSDGGGLTTRLHFISRVATTALVEIPLTGYSATVSVPANTMVSHNLPAASTITKSEVITKGGVHISCPDDITVYAGSYKDYTSDAAIAIPTEQLGTTFDMVSYGFPEAGTSQFILVGTENGSNVKITYRGWTEGGKKTGNTANITLNRGETFLVQAYGGTPVPPPADPNFIDLSGTKVEVTNGKKIAVFTGNSCVFAGGCPACDHMYEQMRQPSTWGTTHYIVNTTKGSTTADILRVFANQNGTNYTINGAPQVALNAGQWKDHDLAIGTVITSNLPVHVAQFLRGSSCSVPPLEIDPLMMDILPVEQYASDYLFGSSDYARYSKHYATVIIETAQTGTLRLDGAPVGSAFTAIVGTNYSTGYLTLARGRTYNLLSNNGSRFGLFVYGYGQEESYGYTAGGNLFKLDGCPIAKFKADSVCDGKTTIFTNLSIDPKYAIVSQSWDFGGLGSSTAINPTFQFPGPGTYNVKLKVTNNNPVLACSDSVTRIVVVNPNPTAFAGADAFICPTDSASLGGTPVASGGTIPYKYKWTPTTGLSSTTAAKPKAKPASNTEYTLEVTDKNLCLGTDKVMVTLYKTDSVSLSGEATICNGGNSPLLLKIASASPDPFTVILSDGTNNITLTGVTNGYTHLVSPTATTSYTIVGFSQPSNPQACLFIDNKPVIITVRELPSADFAAATKSICIGSSTDLNLVLSGSGLKNLTYTDGINSFTLPNLNSPTSQISVNPTTTTTYRITNIEYSSAPACAINPNKTSTVVVNAKRNPGLGANQNLCITSAPLNLFSLLSNSPETGGRWIDVNGAGITIGTDQNTVVNPILISAGVYKFEYKLTGNAPCPDSSSTVTINVKDLPILTNIKTTCSADNKTFQVTAAITNGDPATYESGPNNSIVNQAGQYIFTSEPFPSKTNYTIAVWDANKCGNAQATGYINCGCKTFSGTMDQTPIELCETVQAVATHNNDDVLVAARADSLVFYLHEGNGAQLINPIDSGHVPIFVFKPGMTPGKTYYISAVAGTWNGSWLDFNDPDSCISIAQGTPVRFFSMPTATITGLPDICLNDDLEIASTFTGSAPFVASYLSKGVVVNFSNLNYQDISVFNGYNQSDSIALVQLSDKYCTNMQPNAYHKVAVHDAPTMVTGSSVLNCGPTADFYSWTFTIANGDPTSYSINPANAGILFGNTFTTNLTPSGTPINITIADKYGCGTENQTMTYICPCISQAGTMISAPVGFCTYAPAILPIAVNPVLDPDDAHLYLLSTDINNPIDSAIMLDTIPQFAFSPSQMQAEKSYFVFSVVGNRKGNTPLIEYSDRCISTSNPATVVFHNPPSVLNYSASPNLICTGTNSTINMTLSGNNPFTVYRSINGVPTSQLTAVPPVKNLLVSPTINSTYQLDSISDKYGCITIPNNVKTFVNINPPPTFEILGSTTICEGQSPAITINMLTGIPPFTFTLTDGADFESSYTNYPANSQIESIPIPAVGTHQYYLSTFKDSLCTATDFTPSATVIVNPLPSGYSLVGPTSLCDGSPLAIIFKGITGQVYNISGLANSASFTQLGISNGQMVTGLAYVLGSNYYSISSITNAITGCSSTVASGIGVLVHKLPTAVICCGNNICLNETGNAKVTVGGSAPFELNLFGLPDTFLLPTVGEHEIQITPPNTAGLYNYNLAKIADTFCSANLSSLNGTATITVNDKPLVDFYAPDTSDCSPLNFKLYNNTTSNLPYTLNWDISNGKIVSSEDSVKGTLWNVGFHNVKLTAKNAIGCADSLIKQLEVFTNPVADFSFGETHPTILNPGVRFINESKFDQQATYQWTIPATNTTLTSPSPYYLFPDDDERTYQIQLLVTTDNECVDSTEKTLKIYGETTVFIPNSFTPNGDGVNDVFIPKLFGERKTFEFYVLAIYNRWGQLIFETHSVDQGWDGTFNGVRADAGLYQCRIKTSSRFNADKTEHISPLLLVH